MRLLWEVLGAVVLAAVVVFVLFGGYLDSRLLQPGGMTAINGDSYESQRRAYRYATQAEVCNSLRYMNVILMDDDARLACRLASDGKPGFRIAEFWEKMREAAP